MKPREAQEDLDIQVKNDKFMKKLLISICIGVALVLASCGTTARQAKQKSAEMESAFKTVKLWTYDHHE